MLAAWAGALLVGLSLGLLGSGGSILTVPMLVYIVGEPEKLAIAESLGIVGLISIAGFIPYSLKKQVQWRSVLFFGIPGMAGAYGGAFLSHYLSGTFQLLLFAAVMLAASVMMFRNNNTIIDEPGKTHDWWKIVLEGLGVGMLTGLVGVGGGFMIVPALVLLVGLPMHLAVGTSLAIITLNSVSGFFKYMDVLKSLDLHINWHLIIIFALLGAVGSFVGRTIGTKLSQEKLRKGFAVFLVFMSAYIIFMNV